MAKKRTVNVKGWLKELPGKRSVFLGYNAGDRRDKGVFMNFRNGRLSTKLALSREAMEALVDNWNSMLNMEKVESGFTGTVQMLVKYVGPATPHCYAGVPPVDGATNWWLGRFQGAWKLHKRTGEGKSSEHTK